MPQDGTLNGASAWRAHVAIVKRDDEEGLVFGWLYQSRTAAGEQVVDHSGDVIDIVELEKATYRFAEDSRAGTEMHERTCVACDTVNVLKAVRLGLCDACGASLKGAPPTTIAHLVEVVCFTPEKKKAMGVPEGVLPDGTWIGLRIDRSTEKGKAAWDGVKSGRLKMLSLGGSWSREPIKGAA